MLSFVSFLNTPMSLSLCLSLCISSKTCLLLV